MTSHKRSPRVHLNLEALEDRCQPSATAAVLHNGTVYISCDNNASNVSVSPSGTNLVVRDATNNFSRTFGASLVQRVQFQGGAAADRFVDNVGWLPVQAWGYDGNDYLEGYNAGDILVGGRGDDTCKGFGGDDQIWGEAGKDILLGGAGRDTLHGGADVDSFDGGADFDHYRDDFDLDRWVLDGYSRFDVIQGEAGTCVINAAMAESAEHVNLSGDITRSGSTFNVRLVDNDKFTSIAVVFDGSWDDNDTRPGQSRNSDGTPSGKNNGEFWTVLYQRAFLRLCDVDTSSENSKSWTWSRYNYADHERALYAMSGWTTSVRTVGASESTKTAEAMRSSILNGDLMTAGGTGHAYSIVNVYKDASGNWKVKLFNPWGRDATHQDMTFENGSRSNDGEIILDWDVFRTNFTRVYTATS